MFNFIIYLYLVLSILGYCACDKKWSKDIGNFYVTGLCDSVQQPVTSVFTHRYRDNERLDLICVMKYERVAYGTLEWTLNDVSVASNMTKKGLIITSKATFYIKASDNNSKIKCTHNYYNARRSKNIVINLSYDKTSETSLARDFFINGLNESNIVHQDRTSGTTVYQYTINEILSLNCVKKYQYFIGGKLKWTLNGVLVNSTSNSAGVTSSCNSTFHLQASDNNSKIICTHTYETYSGIYLYTCTKSIVIRLLYNKTSEIASLQVGDDAHWTWLIAGSVVVIIGIIVVLILFRNKRNKKKAKGINVKLLKGRKDTQESNKHRIENRQQETNEPFYINTLHTNESSNNDNALYENVIVSNNDDNISPVLNYASIMLPNNDAFEVNCAPEYAQVMKQSMQANNNIYNNVDIPYRARYVNMQSVDNQTESAYCEIEIQARK